MWLKSHLTTKTQCSTGYHTCIFNINKGCKNKDDDGGAMKEENAVKIGQMKIEKLKNFKGKKLDYVCKLSKKLKLKKNCMKK